MIESAPIEIERKFLIRFPNIDFLYTLNGARVRNIVQTYLATNDGSTARVRRIEENNEIYYVKTVKNKISTLSHYEDEYEIDEARYLCELKTADKDKAPIIKTRYAFPFHSHTLEIDIYPFWNDRAILEIEMASEDESISIPDFLEVIKEVSEDSRYKNTNLACRIPFDKI